ncbi:chromosome segregation protein SMC [bacterium]|nr:chromosome segregation protein SMC [bacterium]
MFLKRLELYGFKTFSQKTEIEFTRGFLAVVGPNGSGKSNLTDAIRFCLGEHSVKAMRATKLDELVFAGTPTRKGAPYAEVTAIFDNSDQVLPLDLPEVAITRRLEADGDSKFFINRTACRLRDIHELLMGSGVGPGSFSVLGGKEVDQVLSTDPKERRNMLEETAGVNRYKFRKREAQRRLEKTAGNLTRLHDILRELELQLEESEKQLERYRKYREAQVELKALELELAIQEWSRLQQQIEELRAKLARAQQQVAEMEQLSEEARLALEQASIEKRRRDAQREKSLGECAELREKASVTRANLESLVKRRGELQHSAQNAQQRLDSAQQRMEDCEREWEAVRQNLPQNEAQLEQAQQRLAQARLDKEQLPLQGHSPHAQLRQRLAVVEKEQHQGLGRRETLRARQESDDYRILELIEQREQVRKQVVESADQSDLDPELVEQLQEAASLTAQVETEKKQLEQSLLEVQQQHRQLENQRRPLVSRLAELEALLEDGSGLPPAVRAVLQWKDPGMLGLLGQLVKVPSGLEQAFEAALGGHVNDIVTRDRKVASGLIERLKQERIGRVTFWPLDLERMPPPPPQLPDRRGVVGLALELLNYPREIESVLSEMLGRTVIMEDMPTALQLYDRCRGRRPHLVTKQGEYLNPSGALTGGASRQNQSGLLSRRRLLDEARQQLQKQEIEVQRCRDREESLVQQRLQADQTLQAAREAFRSLKAELADQEAEGKRKGQDRERLQRSLVKAEEELKMLQQRSQAADLELDELEEQLAAWATERGQLEEQLTQFQEEEARLQVLRQELQSRLSDCELDFERRRQAQQQLESEQTRLQQRRQELIDDQQQAGQEAKRCQRLLGGMESEGEQLKSSLEQLESDLDQRQQELERLRLENLEREAAWTALAEQVRQLDEDLRARQAQHTKIEIELAGLEARREEALERLGDIPEGEEVKPTNPMTPVELEKAKQRASRLRNFLENFGSVNLGAQEDHERLQVRHDELKDQIADLEEGADSLRAIMAELDAITVVQFKEAFDKVNETFGRCFTDLFQGGTARLELCNPDDMLDSGVEIVACPPGKRLQNLTLLSSGERALSAMAFLLSLLTVKPSPIVILDELDAPLDDSNVERVASRLGGFSSSSQFLVITHNRKTMEFADRLYGVTMEEPGVSRILSVKLSQDGSYAPTKEAQEVYA